MIIVELIVAITEEWSEESSAEELIWTYLGEIFLVIRKTSQIDWSFCRAQSLE